MNSLQENIFLLSALIGLGVSVPLLLQVFTSKKAGFFMGLVTLQMTIELLFSWGALSGYNNTSDVFPYWVLLNYLLIPPSIWLFVKYHFDDNFRFRLHHSWLYLPAALAYLLDGLNRLEHLSLMDYSLWPWFSDYLPLVGTLYAIAYFWHRYFRTNYYSSFHSGHSVFLSHLRLLLLMGSFSLVGLLWLSFTFVGWRYFQIIELIILVTFLGAAFLNFLENPYFPTVASAEKKQEFPNYDDQKSLEALDQILREQKLYLKPNLPLKELSAALNLPSRYLSFLINHYHGKNYKEFINQLRIETFIVKARSEEKEHKTLLGLALESGFSSKSTFNQVFKHHLGKSPSEYLGQ